MTVRTAASVRLGSLRYDAHAVGIDCTLTVLPGVSAAKVRLPAAAPVDAAAGDEAELTLESADGAVPVLGGTVARLTRGIHHTEAVIAGADAALAALRPCATYVRQDGGRVIEALARDAGADVGELDVSLPLAAYAAGQSRTGAEHAALLAALAGQILTVDAEGALTSAPAVDDEPTVALLHGRELIDARVSRRPLPPAHVAAGSGPAGAAEQPDALLHSPGRLPEGGPDPGPAAIHRPFAILRTPGAARDAGDALSAGAAAAALRLQARCWLSPHLRPGMSIEVQELPDGMPVGPWTVTRVRHTLGPAGAVTTITAVSPGEGGLAALLAGLASLALGGLL